MVAFMRFFLKSRWKQRSPCHHRHKELGSCQQCEAKHSTGHPSLLLELTSYRLMLAHSDLSEPSPTNSLCLDVSRCMDLLLCVTCPFSFLGQISHIQFIFSNNAGIMYCPFPLSEEMQFATNHLGVGELGLKAASYDDKLAHGQSKLTNILHSNEPARHLKAEGANVTPHSVHPGLVRTNLEKHSPVFMGMLLKPSNS
ncbi:hypothetical protein ZIOFF_028173 [Zingiber officinale]|uniref:Uncharacterized protein n=1 Tax=Zingiber officinale TaxID=94328 RepID=A0A8J5L8T8_ZINOF|nr:hypothetical protein ZIOFF_028173 [Zingiber officinale]